jgi:hypothetical protein
MKAACAVMEEFLKAAMTLFNRFLEAAENLRRNL